MEPYFYIAMTLVKLSKNLDNNKLPIQNALKNLEKASEFSRNNSNLLYHIGLLRFALN